MFERHGADPALLRRYYRVLLLALDVADASVDLVISPERIYDARNEQRVSIQTRPRLNSASRSWSTARRSPSKQKPTPAAWTGLACRGIQNPPTSPTLRLEPNGWRWGEGDLQNYDRLYDADATGQRLESYADLIVVVHAETQAARFLPILDSLWREQATLDDRRPTLSVALD